MSPTLSNFLQKNVVQQQDSSARHKQQLQKQLDMFERQERFTNSLQMTKDATFPNEILRMLDGERQDKPVALEIINNEIQRQDGERQDKPVALEIINNEIQQTEINALRTNQSIA